MTITITMTISDSDLPESDLLDPRRPGNHIVQMMFLQCLFFPAVMLMLMLMFLMLLMLMFLQEQIYVSIDVDDDCGIADSHYVGLSIPSSYDLLPAAVSVYSCVCVIKLLGHNTHN